MFHQGMLNWADLTSNTKMDLGILDLGRTEENGPRSSTGRTLIQENFWVWNEEKDFICNINVAYFLDHSNTETKRKKHTHTKYHKHQNKKKQTKNPTPTIFSVRISCIQEKHMQCKVACYIKLLIQQPFLQTRLFWTQNIFSKTKQQKKQITCQINGTHLQLKESQRAWY